MMLTARLILILGLVLSQATAVAAVPASPSPLPLSLSSPFVGTWSGTSALQLKAPVTIDLVLMPDGRFGERSKYRGTKRMRFGRYRIVRGNVIHFTVAHWEPERACTRAGCEPINVDYEVNFISATKLVLQEKRHAAINFMRVQQMPMPNQVSK